MDERTAAVIITAASVLAAIIITRYIERRRRRRMFREAEMILDSFRGEFTVSCPSVEVSDKDADRINRQLKRIAGLIHHIREHSEAEKEETRASEVEKELNTILADENHIDIESFSDSLKEQEIGGLIIKYAIYALLAVISIISFANLANTMIISITTRRREYGIMQAVGMTGKQLCRSLSFQGLIYTGGTLAVSLAAGIPLGFLAFRWCKQHALFGINVYHFPLAELLFMTAALMAMQLSLSWLLSRNLKRESLVERIRY